MNKRRSIYKGFNKRRKNRVDVYKRQVKKIVKDEMENAVCLDVNLDVDLNIGDSWYDTK